MEVTNTDDHITHAVIGAGEAIEFEISNNAEFFNVLSKSLYTDAPLAVVREYLCNAWDGHIEIGKEDVPIKVTCNQDYLIIEDAGPGIPPELMGPLFGTYGGTDKRTKLKQTGGFGLGCKAGFAVSDHFEVQSSHNGTRTIYNISKSSSEVGGKPGILPIVSVPTDKTGLIVKIPMNGNAFRLNYNSLIRQVVAAGEMLVELDGYIIPVAEFSKAKDGFSYCTKEVTGRDELIYIRYGHVIYPLPSNEKYIDEYTEVKDFVKKVSKSGPYDRKIYQLVLQAEPNTISVTPSREALSLSDTTIDNIKLLLANHISKISLNFASQCKEIIADNKYRDTFDDKIIDKLKRKIPNHVKDSNIALGNNFNTFSDLAKLYMRNHCPTDDKFEFKDLTRKLTELSHSGFYNKGKIQSFKEDLRNVYNKRKHSTNYGRRNISNNQSNILENGLSSWYLCDIILPLERKIKKSSEDLTGTKVFNLRSRTRYGYDKLYIFEAPKDCIKLSILENLDYLQNYVILTHNRTDISRRVDRFPAMKHWFSELNSAPVVIAPRNEVKLKAIRKILNDMGVYTVDLTKRYNWEPKIKKVVKTKRKKAKKGLATLSSVLTDDKLVDTSLVWEENNIRIEKPKFVVKISDRIARNNFDSFNVSASKLIADLFGDLGGVCSTDNQINKFVAQGIPTLETWLRNYLSKTLRTNPNILNYWGMTKRPGYLDGWDDTAVKESFLLLVLSHQKLSTHFNVRRRLSEKEAKTIELWDLYYDQHEKRSYSGKLHNDIKSTYDFIKNIPIDPDLTELIDKIISSSAIKFLSPTALNSAARQIKTRKLKPESVIDFLDYALEN